MYKMTDPCYKEKESLSQNQDLYDAICIVSNYLDNLEDSLLNYQSAEKDEVLEKLTKYRIDDFKKVLMQLSAYYSLLEMLRGN